MIKGILKIISPFVICAIFAFHSCNNSQNCPTFEYLEFDIDTNNLKEPQVFVSGSDTLLFIVEDFKVVSKRKSVPNFKTMDECNNGYYISYSCNEADISYYLYFIRKSTGYEYGTYSYFHDTTVVNVDNIASLNMRISSDKDESFIQTLGIRNSRLFFFRDIEGREWIEI